MPIKDFIKNYNEKGGRMVTGINTNADIITSGKSSSIHSKQGDFKKNVLTCVGMGTQKVMLCSDALISYASPKTGESVNIYHADNYSKDNPMYIIKGLDKYGNEFEKEVNAKEINLNCCSYNDMMILNLETDNANDSSYLKSVMMFDKSGRDSYFDEADYTAAIQSLMKDFKTLGCWDSYIFMDKWFNDILNYANKAEKWSFNAKMLL